MHTTANSEDFKVVGSIRTQSHYDLHFKDPAQEEKAKRERRTLDPEKDKFTLLDMEYRAKKLTEKTGIDHTTRSRVEEGKNGAKYYVVEVVKEL